MCEFVGCKKMLTGNSVHTHLKNFFLFTAFLARETYSPLAELITAYLAKMFTGNPTYPFLFRINLFSITCLHSFFY